jgi:hypothetical protein
VWKADKSYKDTAVSIADKGSLVADTAIPRDKVDIRAVLVTVQWELERYWEKAAGEDKTVMQVPGEQSIRRTAGFPAVLGPRMPYCPAAVLLGGLGLWCPEAAAILQYLWEQVSQ